jgi:hypothetical protein
MAEIAAVAEGTVRPRAKSERRTKRGFMRRAMVLILAAGVIVTVAGHSAFGCSCLPMDARSALAEADGAFIGRLVSKDQPTPGPGGMYSSDQEVGYHFRVERSVKGTLGSTTEVRSADSGISCGIETDEGKRVGLMLDQLNGEWHSSLCQEIDPETLLRAAGPLPRASGAPPPRFMVDGAFGAFDTMTLDARARAIRYGKSSWSGRALGACPGGHRVAQIVNSDLEWGVALRDVRDLSVIRLQLLGSLPRSSTVSVGAVSCRNPEGDDVLVYASMGYVFRIGDPNPSPPPGGRIVRVTRGSDATLVEGKWRDGVFAGAVAFVTTAQEGHVLLQVDLRSKTVRSVARLPSASPDGRFVAFDASSGTILVDTKTKPVRVLHSESSGGVYMVPVWWGNTAMVTAAQGGALILDTKLKRLGEIRGWSSDVAVTYGTTVLGFSRGDLVSASLPHGPMRIVNRFDSRVADLVVLPRELGRRPSTVPQRDPPKPRTTGSPSASPSPLAEPRRTEPVSHRGAPAGAAAGLVFAAAAGWIFTRRYLAAKS